MKVIKSQPNNTIARTTHSGYYCMFLFTQDTSQDNITLSSGGHNIDKLGSAAEKSIEELNHYIYLLTISGCYIYM